MKFAPREKYYIPSSAYESTGGALGRSVSLVLAGVKDFPLASKVPHNVHRPAHEQYLDDFHLVDWREEHDGGSTE